MKWGSPATTRVEAAEFVSPDLELCSIDAARRRTSHAWKPTDNELIGAFLALPDSNTHWFFSVAVSQPATESRVALEDRRTFKLFFRDFIA
ncbi:hypothetical protein ACVIGB_008446 [Bradyrhizobium sp. USDA 4341]